jgi:type IV secretion system protein VirD4
VPPYRLTSCAPLLRLWISGLLSALTRRTTQPANRTLLLCDEAGNLGRMDAFLTASTLLRASGLTLWSFWQNTAQLDLYGTQARTILDNAGVVQLFGARNRRAAQDFAALVGGVDPELLLIEGGKPRFARRLRYFEDAMFTGLYDKPERAPAPNRVR